MKRFALLLCTFIAIFSTAFADSLTEYQQISLGKDTDGNDVMFHFIPVPPTSTSDIFYYDTMERFIVKIDDMASIYDSNTLELIRTFKAKGDRITHLFEDGYIPETKGLEKNNFFDFNGKKIWSTNNNWFVI